MQVGARARGRRHPHCRVSSVLETPPATATMKPETKTTQWKIMSCLVLSRCSSCLG